MRSSVWAQIVSDVMHQPIAVADIPEATARGAALLAFEALGVDKDINEIPVVIERTYYPDSERHEIYRSALERHQKLYQKLVEDAISD